MALFFQRHPGLSALPLGIVVGLAAEARIARLLGPVEIGGGLPEGAEAAAERLVSDGATALLSFGLAGGLDPNLRPGDLVVPVVVLDDGRRYPTDEALCRAMGGATAGELYAAPRIVADVDEKRRLSEATQASAVDLESGAVGRVARRHGLPFAVVRAICDPATRGLPPAALVALDARGAIGLLRVIGSILAHPLQMGALISLAFDAAAARRALVRAAKELRRHMG
jgi:adenosylhomocysteine nucleosidase